MPTAEILSPGTPRDTPDHVALQVLNFAEHVSAPATLWHPQILGGALLALGALAWVRGWIMSSRLGAARMATSSSPVGEGLAAAVRALPPVIDCAQPGHLALYLGIAIPTVTRTSTLAPPPGPARSCGPGRP